MSSFLRQYLETALWSSSDDDDTPLDKNYGVEDFAPEAFDIYKGDDGQLYFG
jgi:hypothetical protein